MRYLKIITIFQGGNPALLRNYHFSALPLTFFNLTQDSLASSAREGGRIAELEKEVTFLTSKLREERLERVRLQETVAELKGKERTSEDVCHTTPHHAQDSFVIHLFPLVAVSLRACIC